ncbi:MAG: hypothetical protein M3441_24170 [Chloroflexota bacterium]|nr:hypothetical protein [Chloroflexota bacterium]
MDVLPDRSADTFARGLREHPGVEAVSRNRGGEYAEAACKAAPGTVQVADRFHLPKNLRDVVPGHRLLDHLHPLRCCCGRERLSRTCRPSWSLSGQMRPCSWRRVARTASNMEPWFP